MESVTTKELKDLTFGDKLMRLSDSQVVAITDIFNDSEDEEDTPKFKTDKYFYFKEIGSSVRDRVMKKMFKIKHDSFVVYN